MKYIFLLSGDYPELAKEEILSLFDVRNYILLDRLLIGDLKNDEKYLMTSSQRLALAKNIYKLLFECKVIDLEKSMKNFNWNSIYRDSFCLRMYHLNNNIKNPITKKPINEKNNKNIRNQFSEKEFAGYIWRSVKYPKVDLECPKTQIELFIIKNKVYCGLLIYENNEDFESRKSHLRPFPHPSSLHPKLARGLVNINGVKENNLLLDPFCGTGGFLIEAGLMNIEVVGFDISKIMVKGCINNLKHFKIKNFNIVNKNALDIKNKFDYVVTDLPYGLNSNIYLQYNKKSINKKSNKINLKINKKDQIKNIEGFYLKFLKKLRGILKKKAVIIFPSYVDYKKLLKDSKFKVEEEFEIYVHRSLTRKIVRVR